MNKKYCHPKQKCDQYITLAYYKNIKPHLEGWDGVGGWRDVQEGGNICINYGCDSVDIWQKSIQYCKPIIFQFKKNEQLKNK